MKRCNSCGKEMDDASRFCDQCGARFSEAEPAFVSSPGVENISSPKFQVASVTSVGIPPIVERQEDIAAEEDAVKYSDPSVHATLCIERGNAANTEFPLTAEESNIGRWDADNGIFPDVDLDAYDPDSKVSRKHARIVRRNGAYFIEDLGSTNGTFVNRGRRLLPGTPQVLNTGDEIIVGKTFLRFLINN
jgi:serine/threonine-protein kinase